MLFFGGFFLYFIKLSAGSCLLFSQFQGNFSENSSGAPYQCFELRLLIWYLGAILWKQNNKMANMEAKFKPGTVEENSSTVGLPWQESNLHFCYARAMLLPMSYCTA